MNTEYMHELCELALSNNEIEREMYSRFNVKRGLRNENGTGVLVGLTEVGDVHGYIIDEGDTVPDDGRLLYRGYTLNSLVSNALKEDRMGYEEVAFLLLFGQLPNHKQLSRFRQTLAWYYELPEGFMEDVILNIPSPNIMNKMSQSVLASYVYDENPDSTNVDIVIRQCIRLIAQLPIMAAYGYQAKSHYFDNQSLVIHHVLPELSHAENLLHLVRDSGEFTPLEAKTLDVMLMVHAEHGGGNNSTFTTHVVSTSGTDTYSAIAAAIGSLKGPRHGGANIKVALMMDDLKAKVKDWQSEKQIKDYLVKILNKEAFDKSGLIYGIGHAVYTKSDPRAVLLKEMTKKLAREKGREDEFELYLKVEELAPKVFCEVKNTEQILCANVDFYSGFVYAMLGIPRDLYTPIFAISRVAGWCAHRLEEIIVGGKIMRPAYKNVIRQRDYVTMGKRR